MSRVIGGHPQGPCLWLVGGIDPLGASGVVGDLRATSGLALWPVVIPSAVTVQGRQGRVHSNPLFTENLSWLMKTAPPAAVKVGMLTHLTQALALLDTLPTEVPLIVDPVLATSSGLVLYRDAPTTLWPLLARAVLITPNLLEAEALLGRLLPRELVGPALIANGARAALVKGGHVKKGAMIEDHLVSVLLQRRFPHARQLYSVRGTGCALATRIAGEWALGRDLLRAVTRAERWLERAYIAAQPLATSSSALKTRFR